MKNLIHLCNTLKKTFISNFGSKSILRQQLLFFISLILSTLYHHGSSFIAHGFLFTNKYRRQLNRIFYAKNYLFQPPSQRLAQDNFSEYPNLFCGEFLNLEIYIFKLRGPKVFKGLIYFIARQTKKCESVVSPCPAVQLK